MWLIPALFLLPCVIAANKHTNNNLRPARKNLPSMTCHITKVYVSTAEVVGQPLSKQQHYECSPVDDINGQVSDFSYIIDLPDDFVESNNDSIMAGSLFANIPGGQVVNGAVVYPFNSDITVSPSPDSFNRRRRRLVASGTRRVLVLRITALDTTNDYSASQLYKYVFDNSQPYTQPTLASQYAKMSFGKLNFVPTQYGVMEVHVPINATGASTMAVRDAAISAVVTQYGVSSITDMAEHVMFCIPPGTGNWAGSSPVVSWRIVMNNQWCGFLSGFMHEMGHNLGLLVSQKGQQKVAI